MKERLSIFLKTHGFLLAHGIPLKDGMQVICRSDLEEHVLVSEGNLLEKELFVKALRKMKHFEAEGVVLLPDDEVISRIVLLPAGLSQKQIVSGLRHSLRGKLPGDPEDYVINYYVPPLTYNKVFIVAIRKEMKNSIKRIFGELKMTLKAIVPITTVLSAGLTPRPEGPVAFLDYRGENNLSLGIGYHDFLTYSAVFPSNFSAPANTQGIESTLRQCSLQLSRHFKAYEVQALLPVTALYLVGSWGELWPLEEITGRLSKLLGLTVFSPALPPGFSLQDELERSKAKHSFIPAVAGLSFFEHPPTASIDLKEDFIVRPPSKPLPLPARRGLAASGAALLLVLLFFWSKAFFTRHLPRPAVLELPHPPSLSIGVENPQKGKEAPIPEVVAPISEAISSLSSLSKNGILLERVELENNALKVTGSCQEEGSIQSGLEDLSKSPNIEGVTLQEVNREKEKLRFTLLVEFKGRS